MMPQEHAHSSAVKRILNCEEYQLHSCGLLRSGRNCWNSMKESREPRCMPVLYDQVEWHKICLLAYV
ncbi:hypothetical protein P3S68_026316 [Capsicum galapagoense]